MAKGKVHRRPRAILDLEALSDYLYAEAGFEVGIRFLDAADEAFDRLLAMPELGASREWMSERLPGLRMWPIPGFPNHLVFYRPVQGGIEVVRVLHAARNIPRAFENE